MESSTSQAFEQLLSDKEVHEIPQLLAKWEWVLEKLPADQEASARQYQALLRHRGIDEAKDLLWLAFAYALSDWSLRQIGMWANLQAVCDVSDVAILNRLRSSRAWLGALVIEMLRKRGIPLQPQANVRLKIMDATVITRPGSRGTDWRLHLSIDLGSMSMDRVEVTDAHGGEGFGHFSNGPNDILLADSIYAHARSLERPLLAGAQVIVREQWNTMPLYTQAGKRFDVIAWLKQTFPEGSLQPAEVPVWLSTSQGLEPLRMLACPLPREKAETARARARKISQKHGRTPYEKNLFAVGFVVLLTNLCPERWSSLQVFELYRWRWQIEMYIKRLKSLLAIDHLRSKDPDLAQTYLLTKLLAAILVDELRSGTIRHTPDLLDKIDHPLSVWRMDRYLIHTLCSWVMGEPPDLERFQRSLPRLKRYLCNSPRKRGQQLALARFQIASWSLC